MPAKLEVVRQTQRSCLRTAACNRHQRISHHRLYREIEVFPRFSRVAMPVILPRAEP
jgi:hypothetical protein